MECVVSFVTKARRIVRQCLMHASVHAKHLVATLVKPFGWLAISPANGIADENSGGFPCVEGDAAGLARNTCVKVSCCFKSYLASSWRVAVTACVTLLISSKAFLQPTQYRCAIL